MAESTPVMATKRDIIDGADSSAAQILIFYVSSSAIKAGSRSTYKRRKTKRNYMRKYTSRTWKVRVSVVYLGVEI